MGKLKDIRRKIYGILSPTYREIKKLYAKLDIENKQCANEINWLKNATLDIRNIVLDIKNKQTEAQQKPFYEKCTELFTLKDLDENYKRDLCAKYLLMAQDDIVKNMCDYIIRNKPFLIFDIGANKGDISKIILNNDCTRNSFVFAYEPILEISSVLENLKNSFKNFDYKSIGIGNKKDCLSLKFNPAIDGLTSFLKIRNDYKYFVCNKNDTSIQKDLYKVDIETLSSEYFTNEKFKTYSNIAIKIDVQGFELEVLQGCSELFERKLIKAILIECTTVQKYETAATYKELFDFLHENGFIIFDMLPVYREIKGEFHQDNKGHLTEFDAIFVLKSYIEENKV